MAFFNNQINLIKDECKEQKQWINSKSAEQEQRYKKEIINIIHKIIPLPYLKSFLVHLVDECNLKCWGCDHFSPLAEGGYLKIEDFEKDIKRISELTESKVNRIALMGGEPLLHPNVSDFFKMTRNYFPKTSIVLVTNGILLNHQPDKFWIECKENNIQIENTVYPIDINIERIENTADKYHVNFIPYGCTVEKTKTSYHIPLDLEGKGNCAENFAYCFHANNCIMLKKGKIYTCSIAPNIEHFNKYFNTNVPSSERDGIDIYKVNKIDEILDFLAKPIPFCKYCNIQKRSFNHPWKTSKKEILEWTVNDDTKK
ncbi:MAG: radical SAM protein [Endomicrobium sp.]|jgi:hypothetical protein|nr:radical SAM protein [Endomicrobium sp.]